MKFFQSKAFKSWAPVLGIVIVMVVAVFLLGASNKAVAPASTGTITEEVPGGVGAAPAAPAGPASPGVSVGTVKYTTYVPTGWSLKFKLENDWRVVPIRNDDGTVLQVSIGTSAVSMSVLHDKPFGKPARTTPILSEKMIFGESVEIETYGDTSYFTVRHDGDDYNFIVKGGLDAFIASIQVAS